MPSDWSVCLMQSLACRVAEDIISMDNGCMCCTVRGDLVAALKQLAERKVHRHA